MNVLSKLSVKNLKLNKKRTISTIIGIILSIALITGVCTLVSSFQRTLIEDAIADEGYYHLRIDDLKDSSEIEKFKNNRDVKDTWEVGFCGYAILPNSKNEYKPYVKLFSMNNDTFENLKFKIKEGRFAKKPDELVISSHIFKNGGVEFKVGDTITFDIGERNALDNWEPRYSNTYQEGAEEIANTKSYTFKIVGIIERPNYGFEDYEDPGFTVITNGFDFKTTNLYMSLKNPRDYENSICEIVGVDDYKDFYDKELEYDIRVNEGLLRWEGLAFSDSTLAMLFAVAGVVIFIIIFTSIFCIRNSFAIAITEKIKMYGMLASVGATKKQIKKNVIFEALLLGVVGIPLGIISGLFAIWLLLKIVNSLIGRYLFSSLEGIVFSTSIIGITLAIILGLITIYLSAISSARRASKVSPIDSLRNSGDIKIKAKKLKTSKFVKKIFKTGGVLALKNLKRSKKKYRTTVISIAVSVFIFISMNTFINLAFGFTSNYYTDYEYNIGVYCSREEEEKSLLSITKLDNIDEIFPLYESEGLLRIYDKSMVNDTDLLASDGKYDEETEEYIEFGEKFAPMSIYGLDSETYEKYLKKANLKSKNIKGKCILVDDYNYYDDAGKIIPKRFYKYSKNDEIKGKFHIDMDTEEVNFKINIGAITTVRPYGLENVYSDGGFIVVNIDDFQDMKWYIDQFSIQSSNPSKLENDIEKLDLDCHISNYEERAREEKAMSLVVKIFLYGFITVITLIGVTNIFNTITSNIELRQKEFAMLKSIGMTKKEFNRMVNLETIFYGTKALLYGIILGILGTVAMYKAFEIKFDTGIKLPFDAIILSIIFVYILVFVIMRYSVWKVNKQNIIETIRKDNI